MTNICVTEIAEFIETLIGFDQENLLETLSLVHTLWSESAFFFCHQMQPLSMNTIICCHY